MWVGDYLWHFSSSYFSNYKNMVVQKKNRNKNKKFDDNITTL